MVPIPLQIPEWALGLAGFGFGAIVGSFLATVLVRWPEGRNPLAGRSQCDGCARILTGAELVPLLSYVLFRGRCKACGARIDWRHPAIELAAGVIGLTAMMVHPLPLALATMVFGWWLLLLAALDAEHQWLPDLLTLPLILAGLAVGWAGIGPPAPERVIGAVAGWLALSGIAFAYRSLRGRHGLGGGDPKLLAALGAWLGWQALPFVLLGAGLLGFVGIALTRLRGGKVDAATRLPLGTLMAVAAWPIWLILGVFSIAEVIAALA